MKSGSAPLGGILAVNAAGFAGWRVAPFMGADFHKAWSDTWYQKRGGLEQGKLWQLFTPSLSHQDWAHMSGNMVLFLYLGKRLHELLGRARFLGPFTILYNAVQAHNHGLNYHSRVLLCTSMTGSQPKGSSRSSSRSSRIRRARRG